MQAVAASLTRLRPFLTRIDSSFVRWTRGDDVDDERSANGVGAPGRGWGAEQLGGLARARAAGARAREGRRASSASFGNGRAVATSKTVGSSGRDGGVVR